MKTSAFHNLQTAPIQSLQPPPLWSIWSHLILVHPVMGTSCNDFFFLKGEVDTFQWALPRDTTERAQHTQQLLQEV